MFMSLLGSRRFAPMFICQFFSALNDNFIKTALAILILFKIGAEDGAVLVSLAGATLVAPFFFLSALGGEIADRFDKARVATWIKTAEIPVAMLAAAGFMLSSVPMLFAALFGFGVMAALFGPIKYGILPDHLETRELPAANALVEGATFAAILCGTIAGGLALSGASTGEPSLIPPWAVALIIVAFAGVGLVSARAILPTGAAVPTLRITRNPLVSTWRQLGELNADRRLWHGGLITSWFWMAGIVVISLFPSLVRDVIGGTENVATAGLAVFTIGIAVGSWAAARASHLRPNLALVPLGALLMGAFALYAAYAVASLPPAQANGAPVDLAHLMATAAGQNLAAAFFGLSAAGGLFVVPAFAAVQAWAPANHRARTIAAVNILNALFMTTGTLTLALAQSYGVTAEAVLITIGVVSALVAIWVVRVWGRDALKDLAYAVFKTFYGLEVKGRENLPEPGARAIITPNHVSFLDGPIMHAITPDHAAFAIDTTIAEAWWVRPFMRFISAFTLDPTQPLATRHLVHAVEQGNTLVIFPEGRLTTTGGLMKVYDGTAMIADHADAEIIPVRITGAERSPWSYLRRSQTRKRMFPKITVEILPARKIALDDALKGKARRAAAGAALQDIMVETAVQTADTDRTLFEALCDAKRTGDTGKPAVADPTGVSLGYGKLIAGAQALGQKLTAFTAPGEAVGVFLPNAAGTVVTFFALQSAGRVPAMLNFTAGLKNIVSACRTAKITTVLTSRSFVEKGHFEELIAGLPGDIRVVYLDELRETITTTDKLRAVTRASAPIVRRAADDPAVILFTSGSEGAPKAVVLSHRNILANALQALTFVSADGEDKVFNVLPVFHAFGLTAGLIMPLVGGIPVYLYPSPLHYRIVPELVYQTNATILFGTDTFLNGYARTAHPYDFHRLRLIVAGAEAVKARTRDLYMEQFGTRILEGYGVTEAAPVIAINTPLANRIGTVGRFVPLLETRLDPVPGIDDGGRLFVRGPNVMLGYMRAEAPGVIEPPPSGWHDTGDIVSVDGEGFVTIRGRAKRFAKVGGEMVSLAAAESLANTVWPNATTVVLAEPDARKGERLVALTTHERAERQDLVAAGRSSGTSELMIPAEIIVVASIPVLGSGKVDVRGATDVLETLRAAATTHAASDGTDVEAPSAGDISPVTA